jgi:hypothetical protein
MAKRKSSKFLPQVFQTSSNNRFLNATLDQLIQEPALKKVYGYIGQQDQSSVFNKSDYYITENDAYAQFYQLEPGVVIKKRAVNSNTYKIDNVYNYPDLLNQVVSDGGINSDHQRMFTNRYYNYNGFVDLDKLTNYRQYYWVPNGTLTVDVTAGGTAIQNDYYVTRVSYTTNNQTEQQSAAIGRSGYTIDGYSTAVNPTLTLVRGGHYNFHVGQTGFPFWIQTEIGTSGKSSVQNNISTRDVLGVVNNGNDFGTITFNVPQKTAQDQLINLPSIQNIDMIVDVPYNQIQGANYDAFIQSNSLDGVRAFDGSYIYINVPYSDTWGNVDPAKRSGVWQVNVNNVSRLFTTQINQQQVNITQGVTTITVPDASMLSVTNGVTASNGILSNTFITAINGNTLTLSNAPVLTGTNITLTFYNTIVNPDYRTMKLTYVTTWTSNYKTFVNQGQKYGHTFCYKNSSGYFQQFPTISALLDTLYYVDQNNPNIYGQIRLIDPDPKSVLNVSDIVGRDHYTSPNGVQFTSGLKVKFTGSVTPSSYYDNEYIVEGVGSAIRLINFADLVTPETINATSGGFFGDAGGYDVGGYDGNTNNPTQKDYITINRSSVDGNSWSRNNRWFHRDVLQYAANVTNQTFEFDANYQAKRPIVEFLPDFKLYNHGTSYGGPVTVVDSAIINAFAQVEGFNNYALQNNGVFITDGIQLQNGFTVLFKNDTDPNVRNTIYQVQTVKTRASAVYDRATYAFSFFGSTALYINDTSNLVIGQAVAGLVLNNNYIYGSNPYSSSTVYNTGDYVTFESKTYRAIAMPGIITTTATFTNGNSDITVASATGIAIGQPINSANVPYGTVVANVSGTTVTMSNAATASGTGVSVSFTIADTSVIPTTANLTSGSKDIIVASNSRIVRGQAVFETNRPTGQSSRIPDGTVVTNISGTTITLSNAVTADGTGVTVSFNIFNISPPNGARWSLITDSNPFYANTTITKIDSDNNIVYISSKLKNEIPSGSTIRFNNTADQITLIPYKTVQNGEAIVALDGINNQGKMFYYVDGTWNTAQIRNSRPQFPLFDIVDNNGFLLGDTAAYPSSNFTGSQLFGYAIGTGTRDSELGFSLKYQSIGNLGDIVFSNYYVTDTFNYNLNQTDTVLNIKHGYAPVIVGWNNYTFANGWTEVSDKSKQYITKTFNATEVSYNNFDLGVVYNNSYYEKNLFVSINGVLQANSTYTITTNATTTILKLSNNLNVGDRLFVKINGTSPVYGQLYTMPRNLTNNSDNTEFTTITLGQVRNHLIEIGDNSLDLIGPPAGSNNFRDIKYNNVGGKLLQHSASMRPAALLFSNPDVDPVRAINFASQSYQNFKNQLLDAINTKQFGDTSDYRACLDTILADFNLTANTANNFYYSDMIAGGNNYTKNTYTIQDTTYRNFNLTTDFSKKSSRYIAALVYLNGVLLVNGFDYTITNFTVSLSSSLTIARLDTLDIYEYSSTHGCNVPPTPSKLGLYPKFKPQIAVDNTYISGAKTVVIGHDGSYNIAYGDYRDNILLEYEKRVYNNIAVEYQNNSDYDLISVQPGAFRKTDYSFAEWTQLLSSSFLTWSTANNVDIFTNSTASNNLFSFNYSTGIDKIFGDTVPGYWRGIYNYFYDTDRPHTTPWEMIGFTSEPAWWQNKYGPGPYSSQNTTMWSDLELGLVYNGAPNKSYINYRYSRPGLSQIIPTDEHGNLLPPNLTVLRSFDVNAAAGAWRVGDQSPAETTWRRSSAYPFAVQVAWCLARPAEYCALKYNTRDVVYNSSLNQITNTVSNNRVFNYAVTGADQYIPGLNVFIRELLIANNLDTQRNWVDVANNSTFNLVYKLSGYTDKSYITVVADQVSPQSTNTSVLIPQENYQIKVTKSAPVARAVYSAVVVQKTNTGYQISGFDKERPYFLAIPSVINSNNYGISVGNDTAVIYRDAQNSIVSFAYGTIFATKQQVVDFLISYGRYLINSGFVFNNTLADNATVSDWSLAAKEFLFWNQQQWGNNTVISLTPAGTNITFSSPYGIVDTISNDHNRTKIINSDGAVLTGRDYRVYRSDNTFTVELKDTQKGIHLIDLIVVQYEHSVIFDNSTVFNDILYDEQVGSRQYRLRLDGTKTQGWNGSFYAPGFLINYSDIDIWYSYTDYYTGDIVLYKNKYYAAQNFIPGKPKFVATDWYEINGKLLSKQLIPNMASGAAQFTNFYNPDEADLNTSADIQSKHATGFQDRQYLTDLGLDRTTQYKFYLGMIAQKGTQAVINAFLRNKQNRIDSDITLVEQWALKLGNYGGTSNVDKVEFNIGNSTAINNQYLFEFIDKNDSRNTTYNSVKPQDLLLAPNNYRTDPFAKTENINTLIPYAGPVNTSDVALTTYDISKIYNISSLNTVLGESSKIWIAADSSNQWGVYRLTQTDILYVTNVNQTSPTELTFTTNIAHGFAVLDYVMLKGARLSNAGGSNISDLSGFYRVSRVGGNVFSVKVTNNTSVSSGVLKAQVFKLVNVRYSTVRDFGAYTPARGWSSGEIVYIDNGPNDGYQVLQNTPNYPLYETKSPIFTSSTDNFGTSIKINKNQNVAIVGASNKNTTGQVFVYGKNQQNVWQEVASLSPDSRILGFGSSVDINNNNIAAISAPGGNYGSIYIATANSQAIAVTQIIHYDNAVVQSADITSGTSNAYVLFPSTTSLANFAAGMGIGGAGIPSGTKIANTGAIGSTFNYIGLTNNLYAYGVTIPAKANVSIYSNLTPGSKFATSMSMSSDGNWLYVGEPVNNQVFVYQYANVEVSKSERIGDGSSTVFTYPATALNKGLTSHDIKVYINGVIKVPELDYYRDPGNDNVAFYTAPALGANISIAYEPYFRQVNKIITADTQASGFGFSVNTNNDGRIVVIGAPNSTITGSGVTNSGLTYVYERTVENLVASGSVNNFQLSNAFVNSPTLTTTYPISFPAVSVDGIQDTAASFNYTFNQVTLSSYPQSDATVSVQTNQFALVANLKTDTIKVDSNYGEIVRISQNNSEIYVGSPGWNNNSRGNGSVWKYINLAKKYGNVTGTVSNFIVAANSSIRINDYLVTFGQKFRPPFDPVYFDSNTYQTASTINAAAIPGITAISNSDGTITISSDAQVAHNNMRIRNESGSVLETMGITQWQLAQKIYSPVAQDTLRFGERLSLSPDSNSLVIGSTLSNNKVTTTFDAALTRFDARGTRFIDTIYRSGAAYLYEYVPSATESVNDSGTLVYGTILTHNTASSLERFASGVDISNNFIMVGAPTANILNTPTGAMYIYYNKNSNPIWQTIRSQPQDFDSRLIERAYIYNSTTSKLIADLPVIDLQHGYLPNSSETYLDYIINYDPAVYSNVPSTVSFSYDRKNNWGAEHVGKLWWDTNSIKYYDNTQGSTLDKFNFWGLAFPASSVVVYEWVESDVVPKDYATKYPLTPPLYTVNDVYSTRVIVDPSSGYAVTKYYFWVRNSTNNNNNRPSALEIQNTIAFPRNSAAPFVAVMSTGAFALYNAQSLIANDTNLVLEYKNTIKPQLIHSEWTLFDDGTDLGIAAEFLNKLNDSLRGQDSTGRQIPDIKLPIAQRYGTAIRPRQSVFSDAPTAKKLFIEQVNNFCTTNPIKLVRKQAIEALNIAEAEPLSDVYKTRVQNITELGYLDTNVYAIGDSVLVAQGISTLGGWGLFRLVNSATNVRSWQVYRVQTYNVNEYWSYADWYSSKFNANFLPKYTLTNESDITKLSLLVGDIIYIINSTDGGWKWVLVNANGLELLAQQNATIQFSSKLYDINSSGFGWQTSSFENVAYAADSAIEFGYIFDVIKDKLMISEYRKDYKTLVKLMIDTISSQHLQTDWLMKTSFVDIYHRVRGLDPLPVYLPQPETIVTSFFSEVKPFHTKLKQYIARYDNTNAIETAYTNTSDFDLQPYYSTTSSKYRSPQLNNVLDTTALSTQAVYQPWVANHLYGVERVDIVNGGVGYGGTTIIEIIGDGTGAKATPIIVSGKVASVVVTNNGKNYTHASAVVHGLGSGASIIPIIGNGLPRTFDTHIKFDRYTYSNSIADWAANTHYTVNTVIVYNHEPYKTVTDHTSGSTFDFTKFILLVVKVWYPQTQYALNDIVIYNKVSYIATADFTSGAIFDSTNLISYNGAWLDNAADRVWAYYSPKSGMAGRDLAQVMLGMEYGGVGVKGPDFNQAPGYDVLNYDKIAYDLSTSDVANVIDIYGTQTEDTYIRSDFLDSGLGLRPQDINVDGGQFVDVYSSHAPEELIPGRIFDTLDIRVKTLPLGNNSMDIKVFTAPSNSGNFIDYAVAATGVSFPIGGIEKFVVLDKVKGPLAEGVDYTVDWLQEYINLNYTVSPNTFFYVIMFGSNGINPVTDTSFFADGVRTDFDIADSVLIDVQQAYVKVNGIKVDNWTLVNKLENGRKVLAVRFDTAPNNLDYVQIHLYALALGHRAYQEIYEQTFVTSASTVYPADYTFTLSNSELYAEPASAYSIVKLNGTDLIPPQQTYFVGDGITTSYSMTNSYVKSIAAITDSEITVVVNNVTQTIGIDYTVYHDNTNTVPPVINFTIAPVLDSKITISDSSSADYRIYGGNTLTLNQNLVIANNSKITILTQGNHDAQDMYTKIFSGSTSDNTIVDTGFDSVGLDSLGFDNELNNISTSIYYNLPHAVININQIYITYKAPGTSGGYQLLPYNDFVLTTPTRVQLDNNLNIAPTGTIVVRIFGSDTRHVAIEYRTFKDLNDNTRYYAITPQHTTKLAVDLAYNDDMIYVDNAALLQTPDPTTNTVGVVFIDGERITYGYIDIVNDALGNIRRGTGGTGVRALYTVGTTVTNASSSQEIPNSQDTFVTIPDYTNVMTFASDKTYIKGSVVSYNGTVYISTQQTRGNLPTSTTYWNIVNNYNDSKSTYITGKPKTKPIAANSYSGSNLLVFADVQNISVNQFVFANINGVIPNNTTVTNIYKGNNTVVLSDKLNGDLTTNSVGNVLISNNISFVTSILVNPGQTIKQGKLFTNIGESLQTSNTQQAIFIRSTT